MISGVALAASAASGFAVSVFALIGPAALIRSAACACHALNPAWSSTGGTPKLILTWRTK